MQTFPAAPPSRGQDWIGYEEALVRYGLDVCAAWVATGRADKTAATMRADLPSVWPPSHRASGRPPVTGRSGPS